MSNIKLKKPISLFILIAFLILSGCNYGCTSPSQKMTSAPISTATVVAPRIGAIAPDFALPALYGDEVQLGQFRDTPVFLNFWATWCPPCRMEMRYLQSAYEKKGIEVKFIAIDVGEDRELVKQFAQIYGLKLTILLDRNEKLALIYNIRYYPTTFLIDGQGVIRDIKFGAFLSEDEVLTAIGDILQK